MQYETWNKKGEVENRRQKNNEPILDQPTGPIRIYGNLHKNLKQIIEQKDVVSIWEKGQKKPV